MVSTQKDKIVTDYSEINVRKFLSTSFNDSDVIIWALIAGKSS